MADSQSHPAASGGDVAARSRTAGRRAGTSRGRRRRPWLLRALAVLIGVLVPLGCLEVLLWSLPVYGGTRTLPVDADNPVVRFQPHREFVWSRDWDFSIVNRVRVNNFGFVSDFDYDPHAADPLLAVIGDSYVEALMVPFGQTCAGRLAAALAGRARVYAFGVSGAPLSQYLAFAEYVRDTFRPAGLAIVVIENDYDESLRKYARWAGMHQFVERSDGRLVLERNDFEVGLLRRLARKSALMRYLVGNLDVGAQIGKLIGGAVASGEGGGRSGGRANGSPAAAPDGSPAREPAREPARVADAKRAVDAFLDRLPAASGLEPDRIAFVVDGLRAYVYAEREPQGETYGDVMRRYFMANAVRRGYETIDLHPAFVAHYETHRRRFEWPQDFHWNALGHEVCFDAVARSAMVSTGLLAGGA